MAPDERPICQQQRRLLLKQVGLEMTLEGAQSRILCSKIGWQTVSCSWSIDGEVALTGNRPGTQDPLTGSSPGAQDQQSPRSNVLVMDVHAYVSVCVSNATMLVATASFQHNLGKSVPECQTILILLASAGFC